MHDDNHRSEITPINKGAGGDKDDNSKTAQVEVRPVGDIPPEGGLTDVEEYERLFKVDEDAVEQPTTTRRELWAYYLVCDT